MLGDMDVIGMYVRWKFWFKEFRIERCPHTLDARTSRRTAGHLIDILCGNTLHAIILVGFSTL